MGKHRVPPSRRAKRRREKRGHDDDWAVKVFEGPPLGPNVVSASVDEVMAAVNALPADLNWPAVADRLVPVFPRLRPHPPGSPEPFQVVIPEGISVGFGIDAGPALVTVDEAMLGRWNISADVLLARALVNVDRLIIETPPEDVFSSSIGGLPVAALQSRQGSASSYVLRPESLARLFGDDEHLVIAPMRNLLLSMPSDTDREFAVWLFEEFALQDPNCLAPISFLVGNGAVRMEPLGDPYGVA